MPPASRRTGRRRHARRVPRHECQRVAQGGTAPLPGLPDQRRPRRLPAGALRSMRWACSRSANQPGLYHHQSRRTVQSKLRWAWIASTTSADLPPSPSSRRPPPSWCWRAPLRRDAGLWVVVWVVVPPLALCFRETLACSLAAYLRLVNRSHLPRFCRPIRGYWPDKSSNTVILAIST